MAKSDNITKLGDKLNDSATTSKSYWKIVNRVMNKSRLPVIPPLIVNNKLILNCEFLLKSM